MAVPVSNQIPYSLFLSEDGDSVEIKTLKAIPSQPQETQAAASKTHEQVLACFNKMKASEDTSHNLSHDTHYQPDTRNKLHTYEILDDVGIWIKFCM